MSRGAKRANPYFVRPFASRADFAGVAQAAARLERLSPARATATLAFDWTVIVGVLTVAHLLDNLLFLLVAAPVMASRQHGLAVLMHDASHFLLHENRRLNDTIANLLTAYPILITVESFRRNHLRHHHHLGTPKDPDWAYRQGKADWEYPMSPQRFVRMILRIASGAGGLLYLSRTRALRTTAAREGTRRRAANPSSSRGLRFGYYAGLGLIAWFTGTWSTILLYWFLPLVTIVPTLTRIRAIAEHFGIEYQPGVPRHDLNVTRTVQPGWFERFFIGQHNVHYHIEHHLYCRVPFYNLPALHRLLMSVPVYAQLAHRTGGYYLPLRDSVFREATTPMVRAEVRTHAIAGQASAHARR